MTYSSNPYDVDPIDILSEQHQNEDDLLDGTNDLLDGFEFNTMMEVEFENSASLLTNSNNILFDAIQEDLEEAEDLWNLAGTSEELPPVEQQQQEHQEQHQEQVQQQQQQPMRRRSQRDRSTSPSQAASRKKNRLAPPTVVPSRQSFSDVSMCSYTTAPQQESSTTHNHNSNMMLPSTPNTINTPLSKFSTTQDYNSQLQNLAASIQRTEESRRVVAMMQRRMLTPEQKVALKSTTERLRHDNQQVQSSVMGRLMQQGRRQLGVYMGQVGQRTL